MKVKNNYNECLTNLACSIRKYFGLAYNHKTLDCIDKIFEEYGPKNVVLMLCDGMGSNILDRSISEDSFLRKNKLRDVTSVFPATTVAATTSITTGLNPVETGMLGWQMYYKDIDKVITVFSNSLKGDEKDEPLEEAKEYKNKHMKTKTIMSDINDKGIYSGYELTPYSKTPYKNIDDMYSKIVSLCNEEGKKFIYAYNKEPDSTMHDCGSDSPDAIAQIININARIEEISNKVDNTIIIVIADHGHINIENIELEKFPDICECLAKNTSFEARAVNFFIKENKKEEFVKLFNSYFGSDFDLYSKDEIIESKLFGDGSENEIFRDALGDYLAIAKSNKGLVYGGGKSFKSQHAGYTDDEIYVPLIVVNKCKKKVLRKGE